MWRLDLRTILCICVATHVGVAALATNDKKQQPSATTVPQQRESPSPMGKDGLIALCVACALLALAIIIAIVVLTKKHNQEEEQEKAEKVKPPTADNASPSMEDATDTVSPDLEAMALYLEGKINNPIGGEEEDDLGTIDTDENHPNQPVSTPDRAKAMPEPGTQARNSNAADCKGHDPYCAITVSPVESVKIQ